MKIRIKGFKWYDRTITLDRLTVLSARAGTGKTAVADAIRFAALGYVPAIGKRPSDTEKLMRGSLLLVEVELPDGRKFRRIVEKTPDGSIGGVECSWLKNAKPPEHHAAILKLFGIEELDVAESLDIRTLLEATARQRSERIEQLLSAGGATSQQKAELVAELTARRLTDKVDAELDKWRDLLRILTKAQKASLRKISGMLEAKIRDGGITAAVEWANTEKRRVDLEAKNKGEARKELEVRCRELPEVDDKELDRMEAERDRLQREHGAARQRAKDGKKAKGAATEAAAALKSLRLEIREKKAALAKAKKSKSKTKAGKLRAEVGDIERELAEISAGVRQSNKKDKAAVEAIQKLHKDFKEPEAPDLNRALMAVDLVEGELKQAEDSGWPRVLELSRCISKELDGGLPHAGLVRMVKELRKLALLRVNHDEPDRIRARLKKTKQGLAKTERDCAQALRQYQRLSNDLDKKVREKETELESVRRDRTSLNGRRDALHLRRENIDAVLAGAVGMVSQIEKGLLRAEGQLEAAEARAKEKGAVVKLVKDNRAELQDKIDDLTRELEELRASAAAKTELARLVRELRALETESEIATAVEWALLRAREQEISEAGGPLLRHMKKFLKAAGRPERPFFRAGRGYCDVGWVRDSQEIFAETLSGSEWALFTAALTSAVIALRAAPVRILLIEAGETDEPALKELLAGIAAVGSQLTAAVVMVQRPVKAKGWTVLELHGEKKKPARRAGSKRKGQLQF